MRSSIIHAKISIMFFQGDEGPIGPSGLTGLEVSYRQCVAGLGDRQEGGGLVRV